MYKEKELMGNKMEKRTNERRKKTRKEKTGVKFVRQESYTDATSLSDKEVF